MAISTRGVFINADNEVVGGSGLLLPIWLPYELAAPTSTPVAGNYSLLVAPKPMNILGIEMTHHGVANAITIGIDLVIAGLHVTTGGMVPVPRSSGSAPVPFVQAIDTGEKVQLDISFPSSNAADYPGLTAWLKVGF